MSSRDRFPSPDPFWPRSGSRSPSRHVDAPEDRQEEHSSADLGWIQNICSFSPAPWESHKIHGFKAALDTEDLPSSSYPPNHWVFFVGYPC